MLHRKTILKWSLTSVKLAYRLLATSAETLCRHSFGERYRLSLLASLAAYFCYASLARLIAPGASPFVSAFFSLYCLLLGYHFIKISLRGYFRVHSYSTGMPWNIWHRCRFPNSFILILIEPGLIFLAGMIVSSRDVALSIWLEAAALCLCIKEIAGAWNHRQHVLDAIDARLENEKMNESIQHRTRPRASGGQQPANPVSGASPQSPIPPSPAQMFGNLDPALRDLFEESQPNSPVPPVRPPGPLDHLPRIVSHRMRGTS